MNVNIIISAKNVIVGILTHVFVRIVSNTFSITDTTVTECVEIIIIMNNVSTKKTKATNVTASINCHSINVRDCYILHTVLLAIILLLIIIIIYYHYAKQKVRINSYTCYYFDDIIQLEDLNLDIF